MIFFGNVQCNLVSSLTPFCWTLRISKKEGHHLTSVYVIEFSGVRNLYFHAAVVDWGCKYLDLFIPALLGYLTATHVRWQIDPWLLYRRTCKRWGSCMTLFPNISFWAATCKTYCMRDISWLSGVSFHVALKWGRDDEGSPLCSLFNLVLQGISIHWSPSTEQSHACTLTPRDKYLWSHKAMVGMAFTGVCMTCRCQSKGVDSSLHCTVCSFFEQRLVGPILNSYPRHCFGQTTPVVVSNKSCHDSCGLRQHAGLSALGMAPHIRFAYHCACRGPPINNSMAWLSTTIKECPLEAPPAYSIEDKTQGGHNAEVHPDCMVWTLDQAFDEAIGHTKCNCQAIFIVFAVFTLPIAFFPLDQMRFWACLRN